jgi:hypothetical protein
VLLMEEEWVSIPGLRQRHPLGTSRKKSRIIDDILDIQITT